jgi:hypothetical protein
MHLGSIVKSLDFPGISDTYMIGQVLSISEWDHTIRCKTIKIVISGVTKSYRQLHFFTAPLQGYHMLDEQFPGRLTVLD